MPEHRATMREGSVLRGIVLDFGGVLWNMRWDVSQALERANDLPRGSLVRTLYRTPTWAAIERGQGDGKAWRAEAHALLEAAAGRSLPPLHDAWRDAQYAIAANVALVRSLRPHYSMGILTNNDGTFRARLRDGLGLEDLFDAIVSSADEGLAKPEPAIYRLAADRLGLPPHHCVFVDDYEPNVTAAIEVGMRGLLFRIDRGDDLAAMLAAIGVSPADPDGSRG